MNIFTPYAPPPAAARRLTKLQFQELLGDEVYKAIKRMALASEDVGLWLDKFNMMTPEADGTSISLDDPRTRMGLLALAEVPELQALGLTPESVEERLA